ncbi:MAG: SDR family oxidoreductase [Terriglobia bacterium]|jgi:NAD(P)-dependent dehydrogenase (short-subunit alcohol dehydrogenase family)|nr:SDR family oxidoreductase [Terriglobia bacterium]
MSAFKNGLFANKLAVITGGGSGINLRIAERFAQQGAKLGIIGRKQEKLDGAVEKLKSLDTAAIGISADVRDYPSLSRAIAEIHSALGPIDILVCGAAGNFPAMAAGMSSNAFKSVVDIDLLGTFNACRAAYEFLRKPGAVIINISAPQAFTPMPLQSHVCAAKAGVDMITRTLAIEWGPEGVRVNSIVPGPIDDTEGMTRLAANQQVRDTLTHSIPLRRFGTKDDIAEVAIFLGSESASYISGTVMVCDGGQSLLGSGPWVEGLALGAKK